jgi:uncharacterized YigZ family protein
MEDHYFTCPDYSQTELKVLSSKFIAHLLHVESMQEAENKLSEFRKLYYDANHNCYAIRINEQLIRYSDDGEPNQTAGKPIFDVLEGSGLYEAIIIVTRYFGGTKLGTGGLVRAYSESSRLVIDSIHKIKKIRYDSIKIEYQYDDTSITMHLIENNDARIVSQDYGDTVKLTLLISISKTDKFLKDLSDMSNGRILFSRF